MTREDVYYSAPETMSGTPVFAGTRVPVASLIDHLRAGDPLDRFLDGFPTVSRGQAEASSSSPSPTLSVLCLFGSLPNEGPSR